MDCAARKGPRRVRLTLNLLILLFSAFVAVRTYPYLASCFATVLGLASLLALVIRAGWLIPCTILGTYAGMFLFAPGIGGGTALSQMIDTALAICLGTALGVVAGLALDARRSDE